MISDVRELVRDEDGDEDEVEDEVEDVDEFCVDVVFVPIALEPIEVDGAADRVELSCVLVMWWVKVRVLWVATTAPSWPAHMRYVDARLGVDDGHEVTAQPYAASPSVSPVVPYSEHRHSRSPALEQPSGHSSNRTDSRQLCAHCGTRAWSDDGRASEDDVGAAVIVEVCCGNADASDGVMMRNFLRKAGNIFLQNWPLLVSTRHRSQRSGRCTHLGRAFRAYYDIEQR